LIKVFHYSLLMVGAANNSLLFRDSRGLSFPMGSPRRRRSDEILNFPTIVCLKSEKYGIIII